MTTTIPSASTLGFAKATLYETHRPSYPLDFVDSFLSRLGIAGVEGARIVDLAAGTGKFTEILATKRSEMYEIVAVEPQDDMRAELERKGLRGVTVAKGQADDMEAAVEAGWADAVVVAQVSWRNFSLCRSVG